MMKKNDKNINNIKKFLKYVCKNNKKKICISAIFVILVTVFDLYLPLLLKKIIDKGIMEKDINILLRFVVIYFLIQLMSILIEFILNYIYSLMRNSIAIKIRLKILKHISDLSGNYYTNKKTGNVLSIIQSDIDAIERLDAELVFSLVKDFFTAIAALYFMIRLQLDLFLLVVVLQLLLFLLQRIFTKKYMQI